LVLNLEFLEPSQAGREKTPPLSGEEKEGLPFSPLLPGEAGRGSTFGDSSVGSAAKNDSE